MAVTWKVRDGRAVWSGRTLAEWLSQLVDEVAEALDPEAIWVFGPVARGDDDADSDIDLLVVLDDGDTRTVADLQRTARQEVSTPVPYDLSFSTAARFTERARIVGTIERAQRGTAARCMSEADPPGASVTEATRRLGKASDDLAIAVE